MKILKNLCSVFLFLLLVSACTAETQSDSPEQSGESEISESYLLGTWVYSGEVGDDKFTFQKNGVGYLTSAYGSDEYTESFSYSYDEKNQRIVLNYSDGIEYFYVQSHTENTMTCLYQVSEGVIERAILYREGTAVSEETFEKKIMGSWMIKYGDPADTTYVTFGSNGQGETKSYSPYDGWEYESFTYVVKESEKSIYVYFGDEVAVIRVLEETDKSMKVSIDENGEIPEEAIMEKTEDADESEPVVPETTLAKIIMGSWVIKEGDPADNTYITFNSAGQGEMKYYSPYDGWAYESFTYVVRESEKSIYIYYEGEGSVIRVLEETDKSMKISIDDGGGTSEVVVMERYEEVDKPVSENPFLGTWMIDDSDLNGYWTFYDNGRGVLVDNGSEEDSFVYTYSPEKQNVSVTFQDSTHVTLTLLENYGNSMVLQMQEDGVSGSMTFTLKLVEK